MRARRARRGFEPDEPVAEIERDAADGAAREAADPGEAGAKQAAAQVALDGHDSPHADRERILSHYRLGYARVVRQRVRHGQVLQSKGTRPAQHQLAEHTFSSDQAVGTRVARLQARGLVERHPVAGRATVHRLTSKGKTLSKAGQEVMSAVVTASAPLDRHERAELARLLTQVLDASTE